MKKTIFYLTLCALLTSCVAWDPSMIGAVESPITPKLLTLERRMEDMSNATVITSGDEMKLFTEEVETNLIDPYGDKYGYIALKTHVLDSKDGALGLGLLSAYTLTIPNLFGMPFGIYGYTIDVEMRVMDRENRLVAKYSATGKSRVRVAYFNGYSGKDAERKAYPDAINDAFDQIRPKIQADAERVNEKLLAAGKL